MALLPNLHTNVLAVSRLRLRLLSDDGSVKIKLLVKIFFVAVLFIRNIVYEQIVLSKCVRVINFLNTVFLLPLGKLLNKSLYQRV